MGWEITTLNSGPLNCDSYNISITGLSANTNYKYRSYFIVDGTEYYGNILTGTTAAIMYSSPIMSTGTISGLTSSSFQVVNNLVLNDGNAPIGEYGILYSQIVNYSTSATLIYGAPISKDSTIGNISTDIPYIKNASGLNSNTTTYYRSFAKNAVGIGYGAVQTIVTSVSHIHTVGLFSGYLLSNTINNVCACAKLYIDPPLNSGESFSIQVTDCSRSYTTINQAKPISSCSYNCYEGYNNAVACTQTTVPNDCNCYNTNTLLINCNTNLSDLTFYAESQSNSSNNNYLNCAITTISNITNQIGGTFTLTTTDTNKCLCVSSCNGSNLPT